MQSELADYLRDYRRDPTLALLPIMVAERELGVSRPTMKTMQRDGRLVGRQIGKDGYITVRSMIDYLDRQRALDEVVFNLVEKTAKAGDVIAYAPVMESIGLSHTLSPHRRVIAEVLGRISTRSWEEHGIMLTAVVVRKGGKPGEGFFVLANQLEGYPVTDDADAMFAEALAKVYAHYGVKART